MHPVDEHRHQDRVIGRMGIAEVRIVVEEGIAFPQVRMKGTHRTGLQMAPEHVHRQAFGGGDQPSVMGKEGAGEILGGRR